MKIPAHPLRLGAVVLGIVLGACGGGSGDEAADPPPATTDGRAAASDGLTEEELRYGVGPIRSLELGEVEHELAERGEEIFETKCAACHKLDERYVGPPLGDVTERRTPEFVMNMILNTDEMVARHPEVKALLAQYYTPMPDQQLTDEDARAVLEYLRAETSPDTD